MSEIWERDFDEICDDENQAYSDGMSWKKAFRLVRQKWQPLVPLTAQKLSMLKYDTNEKIANDEIPYPVANDLCAFCLKAASISGTNVYARNSEACLACCLQGRCFDSQWKIKTIFIALLDERWDEFKEMIIEGLQEVNELVNEYEGQTTGGES